MMEKEMVPFSFNSTSTLADPHSLVFLALTMSLRRQKRRYN